MPTLDPRRSLELLRPRVDDLNGDIIALTPTQWDSPSNCEGWQVADLVAHVARNGWSMLTFVQRTLSGDPAPSFGPSVAHIQEDIKATGPEAAAERQRRETDELLELVQGLDDQQLEMVNADHPSGPRPISWACHQRLVEVAYHHWDLRRSLGDRGPLDAALASYLLPFMLDPRGSSIAIKQPGQDVASTVFRLRSSSDGASWRVTVTPGKRQVEADPSGPADVEISAEAGWLALALYGRTPLSGPHFQVEGAPDAEQRFATAFGG